MQEWNDASLWLKLWREFLGELDEEGILSRDETFSDGTFSPALRLRLKKRKIELIYPHQSNRKRPTLQDGRSLRRYRRRWTIERTVAWLRKFRRLVVRYERNSASWLAVLKVACMMITRRHF